MFQFTDDLGKLQALRGQLTAPTAKELFDLLLEHGIVEEVGTKCDSEMTEALGSVPKEKENEPTITKPQGDEVVTFKVEKKTLLNEDAFEIITLVNGEEKQRLDCMMKVGRNAFEGNSHGDIPSVMLFILELVQNGFDACGVGPATGRFGDGMISLTTALLELGFQISYEVKKSDCGRLGVNMHLDGKSMYLTNLSGAGITEAAWMTGNSSKPDLSDDTTKSLQDTTNSLSALVSGIGVPTTTEQLFETTLILTPPSKMNTGEFWKWCDALMYRVDGTEKCFIQWKEKCAVYYRWTTASSSISGKPMARFYHSNMLVYAQSLPVGHKCGIDIQVVSIEPGKGPTTGRDRYLSKFWFSRCAPDSPRVDVSSPEGLDELVTFLLNVLNSSQDSLSEERLHWSEEVLDLLAKGGILCTRHLPTDVCILNAHQQNKYVIKGLKRVGCPVLLTYSDALANLFDLELYFMNFCLRESNVDSEMTTIFRKDLNTRTSTGVTLGAPRAHNITIRRFTPKVNLRLFSTFYAERKCVRVHSEYVWFLRTTTMCIPNNWSEQVSNMVPLRVLGLFGLVRSNELYRDYCKRSRTMHKPKPLVTRTEITTTSQSHPLNERTLEIWSTEPMPTTGPECMAMLMKTSFISDERRFQRDKIGPVFVGKRYCLGDPFIVSSMFKEIEKTCTTPMVSPLTMEGLNCQAILKRYAAALGTDVDSPLTMKSKLGVVILLMVELTARPYGSSLWTELETFDCLGANCTVKSHLCVEILNWIGIKTHYISWPQQKHALVGITLSEKTYVIEATTPPLDIDHIYARNCLTTIGRSTPPKKVIDDAWYKEMMTNICAKHPDLKKFVRPTVTRKAKIWHPLTVTTEWLCTLYKLSNYTEGTWEDIGTGIVIVEPITQENTSEQYVGRLSVIERENRRTIFSKPILKSCRYLHEDSNFITWYEFHCKYTTAHSLSFEKTEGCISVWRQIQKVQRLVADSVATLG